MARPDKTGLPSNLYKDFFDDATLSDLTIKLRDRSVFVHRIVLCRASEYFHKLILGPFRESKEKVIELCEDDPDAMTTFLRHLYGFETRADVTADQYNLEAQARVYAVAEKYQMETLLVEISRNLSDWLLPCWRRDKVNIPDFLAAARIIFLETPSSSSRGREIIIRHCVKRLLHLKHKPEFHSLLSDVGELGAAIINHQELSDLIDGIWTCGGGEDCRGIASCPACNTTYDEEDARENRENVEWSCSFCGSWRPPWCSDCARSFKWKARAERW